MTQKLFAIACGFSFLLLTPAFGQKWEVGGGAGGSFFTSQGVANAFTHGDASLSNAVAASFWLGNNSGHLLGGELRYDYENTNLKLSSSGAIASFGADTHAVHYDFILHLTPRESRIRPYVSAGAGVKLYRGIGKESAFQPLSNLALLSKTNETTALVSAGGGVKFLLTQAVQFRVEIHDGLTPFPKKVITPAAGSSINGWLQDLMVLAGISIVF